jgi:hypothetical protein
MSDLPFSSEHKARFQELRAIGELSAINCHNERLEFGPWYLSCRLTDSDTEHRLMTRFRAAAKKAAMAAGAPYRVTRLDWWIGKLTDGKPLGILQDLIQRSAEYCEELETRALELGRASAKPGGVGGLYRDRYTCDSGEPYFLYNGRPRCFSDPNAEFECWAEHIWSGFKGLIAELVRIHSLPKRQDKETRKESGDRVMQRVDPLYASMERTIRGLSYDLAVLQANYILDRGLRENAANRAFQNESTDLIERVRTFGRESRRLLGLSYRRQEKQGLDSAKPFLEVGEDLQFLRFEMPAEAPTGVPEHAVSDSFEPVQSSVPDRTAERRRPADLARPTSEPAVNAGLQPAPAMDGGSGVVPESAADQHIQEQTRTVNGVAEGRETTVAEATSSQMSAPENDSLRVAKTGKRRGRPPNQERRDALRTAIRAHGGQWRDHLDDIFTELDSQKVPLGDFQNMKIDLGERKSARVSAWAHLDLADGEQRGQIVDVLRKYTD